MDMEKMKVRELMRPVNEFPRISSHITFIEAVEALQKAQEAFRSGKAPQRILLVQDGAGKILGKAFHLFVVGRHDSLFVTEGGEIVGLIRFSDVYRKIAQTMKECPMPG